MVFRIHPMSANQIGGDNTVGITGNVLFTASVLFTFFALSVGAFAQSIVGGGAGVAHKSNPSAILPAITVAAPVVAKTVPSTFTISINLSDISSGGLQAFQFNILYDPSKIDPSGANFGCSTAGTISAAANLFPTCNIIDDGTLLVGVNGTGTTTGSGAILKIDFATDPAAVAGTNSPLIFQDAFFFNQNGTVEKVLVDGRVDLVLSPTAAGVSLAGRTLDAFGTPIGNVRVALAGGDIRREAISNAFGYYHFDDVTAGEVYLLSATSKRFTFAPRLISVLDELSDLDLIASP